MDLLPSLKSLLKINFQRFHRASIVYSTLLCPLMKSGNSTRPNNIIDSEFVAKDDLAVLIDIDNSR